MVLRNVVPRQGTETVPGLENARIVKNIEKCSSPTGDGNGESIYHERMQLILRNVVPRQGTETQDARHHDIFALSLRNVVPRQGTETLEKSLQSLCISY